MSISLTTKKAARVGYLIGLGWSAKRIADDPQIAATPAAIYRRADEYGIPFKSIRTTSPELEALLKAAAIKRSTTPEDIWNRLICELRMFPVLIDNILDDDTPADMNGVRPS